MWDNLPALLAALGLPPDLEAFFPARAERTRNALPAASAAASAAAPASAGKKSAAAEATAEAVAEAAAVSAAEAAETTTLANLRHLYLPLINEIEAAPAVSLV